MRILITLFLIGWSVDCFANPIRVAVFEGAGVGKSQTQLVKSLSHTNGTAVLDESRPRKFWMANSSVDVLIHPGGSGSKQGNDLGEEGREKIKNNEQGGGFPGVYAGAYLTTNDYTWSNLIDAKVLDRKHWARGTGMVQVTLSPSGQKLFRAKDSTLDIYYGQGYARREWDDPNS